MEVSAAIIALQVNRGAGGKAEFVDFMPHAAPKEVDLEQAIEDWR
jgi:hypothetical protein